ncbi:hypothetical protein FRB99_007745 [Tulasnella sp. 403]|nr:hypothetical protein FRB99_007745 [Tulasnella sp. 403]
MHLFGRKKNKFSGSPDPADQSSIVGTNKIHKRNGSVPPTATDHQADPNYPPTTTTARNPNATAGMEPGATNDSLRNDGHVGRKKTRGGLFSRRRRTSSSDSSEYNATDTTGTGYPNATGTNQYYNNGPGSSNVNDSGYGRGHGTHGTGQGMIPQTYTGDDMTMARDKVHAAEAAEREAQRMLSVARAAVKEAHEHVERITIQADEDMSAPKGSYSIPRASLLQSLFYALFMSIVSIPFGIITDRAITTPHRLPAFGPRVSLRLLLTAYERSRPWVLYLTPGLLAGQALHTVFVSLVFRVVRLVVVPSLAYGLDGAEEDGTIRNVSTIRLSIFILFQALAGTAILCPVEVMTERLSVQRNYTPGAEFEEEDAELAAAQGGESGVEYIGQSEDVLNLRSNSGEEPYKGLRHCFDRIVEEEGVGTLFRAWWLTMLGAVLSGLA